MNYDMFLFHGHGEGDNGASGNGLVELNVAREITKLASDMIKSRGVLVKTNIESGHNNYYRNLTNGENFKYKMGATIHINAGGGQGSEFIVPLGESYFAIENEISNNFEKIGLSQRGKKSRNYDTEQFSYRVNGKKQDGKDWYKEIREAWQNGNSLTIIEVGFIDSIIDSSILKNKINDIATIIANAYLNEIGKPLINISTSAQSTIINNNEIYRVQVGAFKIKENAEKLCNELKQKGYEAYVK